MSLKDFLDILNCFLLENKSCETYELELEYNGNKITIESISSTTDINCDFNISKHRKCVLKLKDK